MQSPGRHATRFVAMGVSMQSEVTLRALIEQEARAAGEAVPALRDGPVSEALRTAGTLVRERGAEVLVANAADVHAATDRVDEGTLDRLRLDDARVEGLARQLEAMAEVEPLSREAGSWTLPNGLRVSERRIPIGAVGANFEARPNVALDVAGQLLKSLNAAVLRTGGAALGTVTVLVDDVLRPALATAGLPPAAVGLVRSPDHEGARLLVSMPRLVPLVILRGSGETTASLARLAAENGVRTLAHAEGGGVLYVHSSASREKALALAEASLDRLGVCNRLNLALVDRDAADIVPRCSTSSRPRAWRCAGRSTVRCRSTRRSGTSGRAIPSACAPSPSRSSKTSTRPCAIANEETSGLAPGIVAEDAEAAGRFLDGYRGTAAFWHATTRFTDGFELTGAPETGINVDWTPGPRGRSRTATCGFASTASSATAPSIGDPSSSSWARASSPGREARSVGPSSGVGPVRSRRSWRAAKRRRRVVGRHRARLAAPRPRAAAARGAEAAGGLRARAGPPAAGLGARARAGKGFTPRRSCSPPPTSPTARHTSTRATRSRRSSRSAPSRS